MNTEVFNRIEHLIDASGLLSKGEPLFNNNFGYNFSEDVVLITGAAGSIGSGLVQHLLSSTFKRLILLDNAETPLFFLKQKIKYNPQKNIEFILGDIRDKTQMSHLFQLYKPTLIFHIAAYKHVSLVEEHPYQAIKTNIYATQLLAQLALEHQSKRFIFISTDKAVNPVGIMGMTKHIAENYLAQTNINSKYTRFISARFGNIFGSNGSVVPLFIKQLKNSVPITVTNKEATRLFIDMNEACNLIIELAKLDIENYNKVSFNMGNPIKIMDLAEVLISKLKPESKSLINVTNLSKGEKLHEILISNNETVTPSKHKKIFYLTNKSSVFESLSFDTLRTVSYRTPNNKVKEHLKALCNLS